MNKFTSVNKNISYILLDMGIFMQNNMILSLTTLIDPSMCFVISTETNLQMAAEKPLDEGLIPQNAIAIEPANAH